MNLPEQPQEIIIEQLRYLPLPDLLSLCQTNVQISSLCRGRRLWEFRLMDDFKVADITRIVNPRDYYFSLLQERQNILNFILGNITQEYFDDHTRIFHRFFMMPSYQDFVNIQKDAVSGLTEERINGIKFIQRVLPLSFTDLDEESHYAVNTLFFHLYHGSYRMNLALL